MEEGVVGDITKMLNIGTSVFQPMAGMVGRGGRERERRGGTKRPGLRVCAHAEGCERFFFNFFSIFFRGPV